MGLYLQRRRPHTLLITEAVSVTNPTVSTTDGANVGVSTFAAVNIGEPASDRGVIMALMIGCSGTAAGNDVPGVTLGGKAMTAVVSIGGPEAVGTCGAHIFKIAQSEMAEPMAVAADIVVSLTGQVRGKTISVFRTTGIDLNASDTMTAARPPTFRPARTIFSATVP